MCGLFGFVAKGERSFDPKRMEWIAEATESRGPHAFGFSWVDERGRLRMFKKAGRISCYLGALSMARGARMLIGHCRFATHGRPANNLNNHPHPCDGGWLVHNGVIHDHAELNAGYLLSPVSECDSETLALLVEQLDGTLVDRCLQATSLCASGPLAMMGLWRSPQRLVAVRANRQPLHWGETREGFYLASLPQSVPNARSVADDTALAFDIRSGRPRVSEYSLGDVDLYA